MMRAFLSRILLMRQAFLPVSSGGTGNSCLCLLVAQAFLPVSFGGAGILACVFWWRRHSCLCLLVAQAFLPVSFGGAGILACVEPASAGGTPPAERARIEYSNCHQRP